MEVIIVMRLEPQCSAGSMLLSPMLSRQHSVIAGEKEQHLCYLLAIGAQEMESLHFDEVDQACMLVFQA